MSSTPFIDLRETLARAGTLCSAAECHGTVCGALCAGADGSDGWVAHLLDEATGDAAGLTACRRELLKLRDTSPQRSCRPARSNSRRYCRTTTMVSRSAPPP